MLVGLGVVVGKEKVKSKVDLEDEQEVNGESGAKSKQAGGAGLGVSGRGSVTVLWKESGRAGGGGKVNKSRP